MGEVWVAKQTEPVIAAGLVLVVLIGGIIGTSLGLVVARRQTWLAVKEAQAKEEARRDEAEQRTAAEQANQQAFEALKSFTDDLMGKVLGQRAKLTENEKAILRNAQEQWEVFARSKGDSPEARVIHSEGAAELAIVQYKCHEDRAKALNRLGKYADALPDWDKCLELCPLETRDVYRFQRVDSRLRSGQVAESIAEVSELAKIESTNPNHWFNFARLYAIASVKMEGSKGAFAERAVELLKKAVARGYKNAGNIARDPDLATLRERADFKKLVAEAEKKP
jgi:tetratricopeptide (TPR) repeat protein